MPVCSQSHWWIFQLLLVCQSVFRLRVPLTIYLFIYFIICPGQKQHVAWKLCDTALSSVPSSVLLAGPKGWCGVVWWGASGLEQFTLRVTNTPRPELHKCPTLRATGKARWGVGGEGRRERETREGIFTLVSREADTHTQECEQIHR